MCWLWCANSLTLLFITLKKFFYKNFNFLNYDMWVIIYVFTCFTFLYADYSMEKIWKLGGGGYTSTNKSTYPLPTPPPCLHVSNECIWMKELCKFSNWYSKLIIFYYKIWNCYVKLVFILSKLKNKNKYMLRWMKIFLGERIAFWIHI